MEITRENLKKNSDDTSRPILILMSVICFSFLFILSFNFVIANRTTDYVDTGHLKKDTHKDVEYFTLSLDTDDRYKIFWSLNYKEEVTRIELRLKLRNPSDYFGFGFSDYGDINGADVCFLWFDRKNRAHFQDTTISAEGIVTVDKSNDCKLINFVREGDTTRIIFERKFDTCDPKDYKIEEGTTHLVYVTGKGMLKHLKGLDISGHEHGMQRMRFLKNLNPVPPVPSDAKSVVIVNNHTKVPSSETTYWCSLHELPKQLSEQKHHIIEYEAVIQPGNEALVHHLEVFHCEVETSTDLPHWDGGCFDPQKPPVLGACKRVVAAWAMGAGPLFYPIEAGLPIGGANFSRYVMLEIHYNNPQMKSDWIDSSGIKLVYTDKLRQNDVGVLEIGLEYIDKNSIPPNEPGFDLSGYCVTECTRIGLPVDGITIFASQLHTHLTGIRVWTKHVRAGQELPEINRDNHYSQHFQEIRLLKNPVKVLPGDALINTCRYDTRMRPNMTLGGHAIVNEMCVNYIHYYPKTDLEVCKSSIDSRFLINYFKYMKAMEGERSITDEWNVSQNFNAIHWSRNKALFLSKLYEESPLSMQCNRSSGDRFPGTWEGVPVTRILEPSNDASPDGKCEKSVEENLFETELE